jgi:hypothetical protein
MMKIDLAGESAQQPGLEVIDSLCAAIQRQSATCWELVTRAVELEREQCAILADQEVQALAARLDDPGSRSANRIAGLIRARARADSRPLAQTAAIGRLAGQS